MNSKTASAVFPVSQERAFSYLSDIDNMPAWATEFCRELKVVDGKNKVVTPMGEMFFRIDADEDSGVIDIYAGPTEDQMALFPTRVIELPGETSAYLFTLFQPSDTSDEAFAGQFASLELEFENLQTLLTS